MVPCLFTSVERGITDASSFRFCAVPGTTEEKGKLTMGEASDGVAKDWVKAAQAAGCKAVRALVLILGRSRGTTDLVLVLADALCQSCLSLC